MGSFYDEIFGLCELKLISAYKIPTIYTHNTHKHTLISIVGGQHYMHACIYKPHLNQTIIQPTFPAKKISPDCFVFIYFFSSYKCMCLAVVVVAWLKSARRFFFSFFTLEHKFLGFSSYSGIYLTVFD